MSTHKSALVTESMSGVGAGFAEAFAREESNVVLNHFGPAGKIKALDGRKLGTTGTDVQPAPPA